MLGSKTLHMFCSEKENEKQCAQEAGHLHPACKVCHPGRQLPWPVVRGVATEASGNAP